MTRYLPLLLFCFNLLAASPSHSADKEKPEPDKPLKFSSEVITKDDSLLAKAMAKEPLMIREKEIEAPLKMTDYFLSRPWLTYRLAEELTGASFSFSLDKTEGEWELNVTSAIARSYNLTPLSNRKSTKVLKFVFLFKFALGIGIKSTGGGFVVIRSGPNADNDGAVIDYDIYLVTGSTPIDKLTKQLPFIHNSLAQADMELALMPFIELCELVADDPESVAEEMEEADEVFSKNEIEEFKRLFVKKGSAT